MVSPATLYTKETMGDNMRLEWAELEAWFNKIKDEQKIYIDGQAFDIKKLFKDESIRRLLEDPAMPRDVEDATGKDKWLKLSGLYAKEIKDLKEQIRTLNEQSKGLKGKELEQAQNKEKALKFALSEKQRRARSILNETVRQTNGKGMKGEWFKLAKSNPNNVPKEFQGDLGESGTSATATWGGKAQKMAGKAQGEAGTPKSGKAQTGGTGQNVGNWGAMSMPTPKFTTAAYANSLVMENNILNAWDNIHKNTTDGRKMMMIMYFLQKMAASGDLYWMYQLMNFVLVMISKDKALQNIHMANKLIELQNRARDVTNSLMNFKNDPNDASNVEFTKALQMANQESNSIAMSQKLIAQMMEEFAQVVETLTNVTKGVLDKAGKVAARVAMIP